MANIVNVKVKYIRPEYQNLKMWMIDPQNVYIGRKGIVFIKDEFGNSERFPKKDSIWANPFKIDKNHNREKVLELYEAYIIDKIENEKLYDQLSQLEGKNLGCWCYPEPCHGDILKKLINLKTYENFKIF